MASRSVYRSPIPARQVRHCCYSSDEIRDQWFTMVGSRRLQEPSVSMMNTRKILMIIGGLLLVAAGTTYLMLLQADRRSMAEVTAAMHESAHPPVVDSRAGDQVTEGTIDQSKPSGAITKSTAIAQEPVAPAPASAPALAVAPAPMTAAPASSPAAAQVTGQPKPEAQPKQAPSTAVASVNVQDSGAPKVVPAHRAQRGRDGLDHRAITTQGATPETDELVRESAKLDPSLPPPDMSAARVTTDQRSSKPGTGSNPVAAAMTDQLVKESAKLDPSLPPPK
ncbi:hypothetical protein PQR70_28365 [Paraburkholderia madseniana]|uniref:Extensin n=1 Tax=Paraburkholderia madseniana TaxID=2599607 RepID=A0AAP5BJ14_9BURK|nr:MULTISPECIES: hypothetical protein [Paraburkholderia]MCX4149453.1 hypothetical protein [Paraburkholderia madseniana]MDN7152388.1 hypothetical protein [Paraburkholderia sp. WS6]MDQ6411270.1 hypothetical protein [Paraburkholderia madseniana]